MFLRVQRALGSGLIASGFRSRLQFCFNFGKRALEPQIFLHIRREVASQLPVQFLWCPEKLSGVASAAFSSSFFLDGMKLTRMEL